MGCDHCRLVLLSQQSLFPEHRVRHRGTFATNRLNPHASSPYLSVDHNCYVAGGVSLTAYVGQLS